jgi:RimJ/RimL family protein N-acetyltransferase
VILLETERLVLRRMTEADLDDLVALHNDAEVMRYINGGAPVPREELARDLPQWNADPFLGRIGAYWRGGGFGEAGEPNGGQFVGWFGLRTPRVDEIVGHEPGDAELGYRLRRAVWGRGLATEGARELLRYAFMRLDVPRVIAHTMAVNRASQRVMEKAGLKHVSTYHIDWPDPLPGTELGEVLYGLTADEWRG